jgi:hypothetical protein
MRGVSKKNNLEKEYGTMSSVGEPISKRAEAEIISIPQDVDPVSYFTMILCHAIAVGNEL